MGEALMSVQQQARIDQEAAHCRNLIDNPEWEALAKEIFAMTSIGRALKGFGCAIAYDISCQPSTQEMLLRAAGWIQFLGT